MNWFTWIISGNLLTAVSRISQKYLLKKQNDLSGTFTIFFQLLPGLILMAISFLLGEKIPNFSLAPINWIIAGISFSIGVYFLFKAYSQADVSTVSIISTSGIIWTMFLGAIILKENVSFIHIVGSVLIVSSLLVLISEKGKFKFDKGTIYALIAFFAFGIGLVNEPLLMKHYSALQVLYSEMLINVIFLSIVHFKDFKRIPLILTKKNWLLILIATIGYTYGTYAILASYQAGGDFILITPLNQLGRIFIVILGIMILGEKDNLKRKIIATILAVIGALIIKMF